MAERARGGNGTGATSRGGSGTGGTSRGGSGTGGTSRGARGVRADGPPPLAVAARLALSLAALAATAVLLALTAPDDWPRGLADLPRWLAAPPPETRLLALATVAAYGCLAWLGFALVAVAAGSGVARFAPAALRRLAERVLGVALTTAAAGVLAAGPAAADAPRPTPGAGPFDRPVAAVVTRTPAPLTALRTPSPAPTAAPATPTAPPTLVPGDPFTADRPVAPLLGTPRPERDDAVVVRRGDTLWGIAARHLGPDATPAEIAAEWPRWYAANRAVVGPDPDLIRPGQRLVPPAA